MPLRNYLLTHIVHEFGEITKNKGHYAIQSHSVPPILVPITNRKLIYNFLLVIPPILHHLRDIAFDKSRLSMIVMAALRSRCGHYIFALWFLLSSSSCFFPRLISAIGDWMSTIKGRTIQPKLDRTDPVKSAASESAIQYRSDTNSDLPWTVRKYMPISKRKCTRSPAIAEGPRDAGVPVEIW